MDPLGAFQGAGIGIGAGQNPVHVQTVGQIGRRNGNGGDPGEDVAFGNQTTQSEPSIAVHKKNVVVAYNDSTLAPNYTGFSGSSNGGALFTDHGGLPGNQSGDNVLAVDRHGTFYYATLSTDGAGNRA
jgi:hypothetical protein